MKLKKNSIFYIMVIITALLICSCSSGSGTGRMLSQKSFSKEFSDSPGFQKVQGDVIDLYNMVETAYNKSDKKTLASFQLDKDQYYDLYYKVYDFADQYGNEEDDKAVMAMTALNTAKISVQISGFYVLQSAGLDESTECFEDIDKALQEVYDSFTGNSSISNTNTSSTKTYFDEKPDIETPDSWVKSIKFEMIDDGSYFYTLGTDKDKAIEDVASYLAYLGSIKGFTVEDRSYLLKVDNAVGYSIEKDGISEGTAIFANTQGAGYILRIKWY